jgi:hypothetical protein
MRGSEETPEMPASAGMTRGLGRPYARIPPKRE